MTKTSFRKALAIADLGKAYTYTELSRSGNSNEYLFRRDHDGYTLRNETTGYTVFMGENRKFAEEIMVH